MENPSTKAERLQALHHRWFSEPLQPRLLVLTDQPEPTTRDALIRSYRVAAAFSSLSEAPELAGMTPEQAQAHDRSVNSQRFGVEEPRALMLNLSSQIARAPTGQVDPVVLKKGVVVLEAVRNCAAELAAYEAGKPEAALHQSDEQALAQAIEVLDELATELGVSIPLSCGGKKIT